MHDASSTDVDDFVEHLQTGFDSLALQDSREVSGYENGDGVNVESSLGSQSCSPEADHEPEVLAKSVFSGISEKMKALQRALDEKTCALDVAEKALEDSKRESVEMQKSILKQSKAKLATQKNESEEAIARQLAFVDRLLKDKQLLNDRCEGLSRQIKDAEDRFKERLDAVAVRHRRALEKQKEMCAIQERTRRQHWEKEKLKQLKAQTARSLEPEIQRLVDDKREIAAKKDRECEERLQDLERRLKLEHQRELCRASDLTHREHEVALRRTREEAATRSAAQIERFQAQLAEQRRELHAEFDKQRALRDRDFAKREHALEAALEKASRVEVEKLTELQNQHSTRLDELSRKHAIETKRCAERALIEREQWQQQMSVRQQGELQKKEHELRERVERESREELDMLVERFTEETRDVRKQCEAEAQDRLLALRSELTQQVDDLRKKESYWHDQYMAISQPHAEAQTSIRDYEARIAELEAQLSAQSKQLDATQQELSEAVQSVARKDSELDSRISRCMENSNQTVKDLQEEASSYRATLERERSAHEKALEALESSSQAKWEKVELQVRATVAAKERSISQLRAQLRAKEAQIRETEALLQQHRSDILRDLGQ